MFTHTHSLTYIDTDMNTRVFTQSQTFTHPEIHNYIVTHTVTHTDALSYSHIVHGHTHSFADIYSLTQRNTPTATCT